MTSFSADHLARSRLAVSRSSESRFSISSRRARASLVFSFVSARFSMSSDTMRRSTSSISAGTESICVRRREAASSTRSMALSGRKRSVMYRAESRAAATSAASVMRTPW